jgi:hypothetical protein
MRTPSGRKALSAEGLLRTARGVFAKLPDAPRHDIALVDHLEYWEQTPDGRVTHFAWVTDIPIDATNLTCSRGFMRGQHSQPTQRRIAEG